MDVVASSVLANGLRTEFADTYLAVQNRQADGRLSLIMDGLTAWNRQHEFAYFEAAPHVAFWRRGDPIPEDANRSVTFTVPIYNFGRRISWHRDDRADDQTSSLYDSARQTGMSAALLPERMAFDLLLATTNTLPATQNAPDGAAMFATTAGGAARFGVTNGNLLSTSGTTSVSAILTDFYAAIAQFRLMQDGKGQPLWSDEVIQQGFVVIYPAAATLQFEQAFLQRRQGLGLTTAGVMTGTLALGVTPTNIVQDASRDCTLWGTQRITTSTTWFVILKGAPKKPLFMLDRQPLMEFSSLIGDNNSDTTRNTGQEYVQWDKRVGAGVALPFSAIKIA
jgi:hypothetical protein